MVDFRALPLIGKTSTFTVAERVNAGLRLQQGSVEVLLPNKYVTAAMQPGSEVQAFLYTDSEDRLVATTRTPLAQVGDFAFLRVVDESVHGAFLNWGLEKDLFVPKAEQHAPMRVGRSYVVAVFLDNHTGRVAAASRLAEFLDYDLTQLTLDEKVSALVYHQNERGYQVIVNDRYPGMLYRDQTFTALSPGSRVEAYVDAIRADNKLDLRLSEQRVGSKKEKNLNAEDTLLQALKQAGGSLPLGDKSPPEQVYEQLGISKKAFKAAAGALYKKGLVIPGADEIRLGKEEKA